MRQRLEPCVKLRIDNGEDISDLFHAGKGTISVPALATPVATPAANVEDNNDGTANLDDGLTTVAVKDAHRKRKRKRVEGTEEQPSDDDGLANARRITVKPTDDLINFWNLCMALRGSSHQEPIEEDSRARQLPKLIKKAQKALEHDNAIKGLHTIKLRCLLIELATMYVNLDAKKHELRKSFQQAGNKLHGNRGVVLDYLVGQLYDSVPMFSLLEPKDPRRKKVEDWLRIACPLLSITNYCGFVALIAPCMRICDEE